MQKSVEKAIEEITYRSKTFPAEAFRTISENREAALPYLRAAIEKAILEKGDLEDDYELHFFALFFLGEFQERSCFSLIMELASLPEDTLDCLIGDLATEGFNDILYNTYNGDLDLLKSSVRNCDINEYVRCAMLDVMGQLYLDGELEREELQGFIRELVHGKKEIGGYIYSRLAAMICDCHFADMFPEIRWLYKTDRIEEFTIGKYDDCVDMMFQYHPHKERFCKTPVKAAGLRSWAMFEQEPKDSLDEKALRDYIRKVDADYNRKNKEIKVGRNDPCPCGSGKKYKKCCLNKPKPPVDLIESEQDRKKWLEEYPGPAQVREAGRVYLEDYYDAESIEIDKLVYLALHHRAIPIWHRESEETIEKRKRLYLKEAYAKFVEKAGKEGTETFREYDERYSIHYQCQEWMDVLLQLLKKGDDKELYKEVSSRRRKMK